MALICVQLQSHDSSNHVYKCAMWKEKKQNKTKTYHLQGGRSPHHRLRGPPGRRLTLTHLSASRHPKTYHRSLRGWL